MLFAIKTSWKELVSLSGEEQSCCSLETDAEGQNPFNAIVVQRIWNIEKEGFNEHELQIKYLQPSFYHSCSEHPH